MDNIISTEHSERRLTLLHSWREGHRNLDVLAIHLLECDAYLVLSKMHAEVLFASQMIGALF